MSSPIPYTFPNTADHWRIKKLSVYNSLNVERLLRLLRSQRDYLEELDVTANSIVLDFIIRELRDLKKLKLLFFNSIPKGTIFDHYSIQEVKLKELTIFYAQHMGNCDFILQILQHFSMVEILKLECYFNIELYPAHMPINLPNLHTLEVLYSDNCVLQRAAMSKLRKLTVQRYIDFTSLALGEGAVRNYRTIESLEELIVKTSNIRVSEMVQSFPNLKHLKLGNVRVTAYELKKILQVLQKLVSFTLNRNSWESKHDPKDVLQRHGREQVEIIFEYV